MKFIIPILLTLTIFRIIANFTKPPPFNHGDKIRITAKISFEPIRYERSQYLKLQGLKIYLPLYPEISYSDRVVIEGIVDLKRLKGSKLLSLNPSNGALYKTRSKLNTLYKTLLPSKEAALVSGMAIGSKSDIPADFWQALKKSGTAHVVVASGMNVTLIAGFLIGLVTVFFKRRRAIPIVLAGIWLYALLAGFEAPIIRAAIMGTIAFLAQEWGRVYFALKATILSALLMLLIKPDWINDYGFILSFMATLSLIFFTPKVTKILDRNKVFHTAPKWIKDSFITTLSAQVGVLPVMLFVFGQFNPLSPFINVLVLWTVPLITAFGLIGGFVGLIIEPLGKLILLLGYPLMKYFVFVVNSLS